MKKGIEFHLVGAALLGLTACAPADLGNYVASYEQAYKTKHTYKTHMVKRDGYQLHAREFGTNRNASDTTFILLHGFPDSSHLYDRLSPILGKKHRTIAFDFLGWGASDKPSEHLYNAASLRRDLDSIIKEFGLKKVTLVAHDISGFPVIDWSLDNPNRIDRIVLLNTIYGPSKAAIMPEAIARYSSKGFIRNLLVAGAKRSDRQWQSGFFDQVGKFYCDPEVRNDHLRVLAHQARFIRPAFFGLNSVFQAEIKARAKMQKVMERFTKPVQIIFGAKDKYLNIGVAREFAALFPNSKMHLVKEGCHYVQLDRPEEVAKLILSGGS